MTHTNESPGFPGWFRSIEKKNLEVDAVPETYQTSIEPGKGRPLDLISPTLINDATRNDPLFRGAVLHQIAEHLRNWERTRNGAFIWIAWRCAMHLDSMPTDLFKCFVEYFNESAINLVEAHSPQEIAQALLLANRRGGSKGRGFSSTAYQAEDYWFWVDYTLLKKPNPKTGVKRKVKEIHDALAKRYGLASGDAAKQRLLRIRQSGQYANRSRIR